VWTADCDYCTTAHTKQAPIPSKKAELLELAF
jgi:AhpD family alkylhydroperoxidase